MAIQGIFLADFSQYNAAVDQADAKLRKFTSATTTHDTAVTQFNRGTANATSGFGQLSQGLSAADKTLAAFGVHIGPEIHALQELATASGQTATQIGAIGTASLVAAAALGGWEIGRTIAKFFDLDNAIANTTARWLGYGDVVAETAGAKQDVINRAIKNGADATITYTQAVQFNIDAAKKAADAHAEHAKQLEAEKKAANAAAEALTKLQEAHVKEIQNIQDKLFGADDIKRATDYVDALGRVENVANLDTTALQSLFEALTAGISKMVEQGLAADDLTNQMEQYRLAVVAAQQSHTQATTQMESDEARLARESAELAKAMSENFVIIGQSAQDAAQKTALSWSQAMDAVRAGQGTLTGTIQGLNPNTPGAQTRYDDYNNPYVYVPGINNPGKISPSGGTSIFVDARESMFDTPAGMQRLAERVINALGTRSQSRAGR